MEIDWWGAYGYGDVIHSLGYANTFSKKSGLDVTLNIHWDCGAGRKFHADDPETKIERFNALQDEIILRDSVKIVHKFRSMDTVYNGFSRVPEPGEKVLPRYKNVFDETISLHALVEPKKTYEVKENQICIWTPDYNIHSLYDWKNTLKGRWQDFRDIVEDQGFDVVEISYREPIEHAIYKVASSQYCTGYGGMGKGLAGLFWKPFVSISDREHNTHRETPWAVVKKDETEFHNLRVMLEESKRNIARVKRDYSRYINNEAIMLNRYVIL